MCAYHTPHFTCNYTMQNDFLVCKFHGQIFNRVVLKEYKLNLHGLKSKQYVRGQKDVIFYQDYTSLQTKWSKNISIKRMTLLKLFSCISSLWHGKGVFKTRYSKELILKFWKIYLLTRFNTLSCSKTDK